jgi:hypothetical protein
LVITASKKSTAMPLGGVSPIVRSIGVIDGILVPVGDVIEEFVDPPHAARKRLVASAIMRKEVRHMHQPPTI